MLFAINIIGLGLGPWLIGISNDLLAPAYGDEAIRYSLGGVGIVNLWAAAHSLLAGRYLRSDLARARGAEESDPDVGRFAGRDTITARTSHSRRKRAIRS